MTTSYCFVLAFDKDSVTPVHYRNFLLYIIHINKLNICITCVNCLSEREKEEERKKKDDEKRQKIEAEENKKRKTAKAFAKFFVPKKVENKSDANELDEHHMDGAQMPQIFKSFQLKEYMKMAPVTRRTMNCDERSTFAHTLSSGISENDLYLSQLKRNMFAPRKSGRTWPDDDDDKSSDDDLFVIGKSNFLYLHFDFVNISIKQKLVTCS